MMQCVMDSAETVLNLLRFKTVTVALMFLMPASLASWAGSGGRISGTVTDPSHAVVAGAVVVAANRQTGAKQTTVTNDRGFYSFLILPVGRYDISISRPGFKVYRQSGIALDADSSVVVDAVLHVGENKEAVTVEANGVHVETSDTQMGEVISDTKLTTVPLNGRSYTDLLALQPGVVPASSLTSSTQQDVGVSALLPSGQLNPGTISINGQREFANGFTVNGSDVEEDVNAGTAIIPNLDSVAEFRILTNNPDAEYGGHSGGQITVVTKSGGNAFHGDLFEFLRNTDFDARNYFSPTRGEFDQNQFGGTFGGPIKKNNLFFFTDYQGTRLVQGVDTAKIAVPLAQERTGDLSGIAGSLTGSVTSPATCSSGQTCWADHLSQQLGYPVTPGEPYYFSGCALSSQCVFPNAIIPKRAWSAPAQQLLQYVPMPNVADNLFATSAYQQTLRDDKGSYRLDSNSRWGLLTTYLFLDDSTLNNPYPVSQSGASVPGFNALYLARAQLLSLGDTKAIGTSMVNEFHFGYLRDHNDLGRPIGGVGVSLASQGFVTGVGTPGIVALNPNFEGVENIVFNAFSIGTNANELRQVNNTFQWIDNFSKVIGRHALKFGSEFHYDQVNTNAIAQFNGNFLFAGSETGSDFADFLLGIPSQYNQSQLLPFYGRNKFLGLYAQDSWRVTSNLVLNYGLRWDRIEPWYEKNNGLSTFEAGRQSLVFPGAPAGILFPTDPGVSRTIASPGNLDFEPRVGIAYSPRISADSLAGKLLGGPGNSSIRVGFGMNYTAIEALSIGILAGNAPFGITYSSPAPPLFATPFITASTGRDQGQSFPVNLVTQKETSSHPDSNVNWSQYEPISGIPGYATTNRIPYVRDYMLSLQRQFGSSTALGASYVGAQGRRLLVMEEANPGNPSLCLSLPGCGPFQENNEFRNAAGQTIYGTRAPLGFHFGSDTLQKTIGESNFNAFELSLRHTAGRLQLSAAYTYGKSLDDSSNLGEEVNPLNPSLSYALSSFDIRQNFVVSYSYRPPIESLFRASSRWTQGWELSGITHFSSGLPVTLASEGDNSLLGAEPNGINNFSVDEPNFTPGPLQLNHNPRNGQPYFNLSLFASNALGTPGTAKRRFFAGPGMDNYDIALLKNLRLTESKSFQFRVEAFNIFNHAQFFGPQAVDGNIGDLTSTFAHVVTGNPPRLIQLGLKFLF